jgi:hypothetical protein
MCKKLIWLCIPKEEGDGMREGGNRGSQSKKHESGIVCERPVLGFAGDSKRLGGTYFGIFQM